MHASGRSRAARARHRAQPLPAAYGSTFRWASGSASPTATSTTAARRSWSSNLDRHGAQRIELLVPELWQLLGGVMELRGDAYLTALSVRGERRRRARDRPGGRLERSARPEHRAVCQPRQTRAFYFQPVRRCGAVYVRIRLRRAEHVDGVPASGSAAHCVRRISRSCSR